MSGFFLDMQKASPLVKYWLKRGGLITVQESQLSKFLENCVWDTFWSDLLKEMY